MWFQGTEYRDRSVQAGKQYDYRVTAVGAGGSSEFSETSGFIKAKPLRGFSSLCSFAADAS
jgi:fibronectin type 3 domain-containing protein